MGSKKYNKPKLTVDELSAALYQANEELKKKNEELLSLQQAQKEVFANISHDLRSPITAIRSAIEYVTSSEHMEEDELRSIFHLVTTRITGLEELINDMFLMTRLDNNIIEINMQSICIGPILEEYYFSCEAEAKYQGRNLLLAVPELFNYKVCVDPSKLIRVLDNLFTNAYKYSAEDSTIELGAKYENDEVIIWVKDHGIGFSKDLCNKVFERTFTVSSARTPESSTGAGLGLSIAKLMIEKMGGRIWCTSEPDVGSTFFFSLQND